MHRRNRVLEYKNWMYQVAGNASDADPENPGLGCEEVYNIDFRRSR